jgi:hypothetical protein
MTNSSGNRARGRALQPLAGALAAVLLIAACEGSNLFEGEVAEEAPEITALTAPSSVDSGEPFVVQVTGRASRNVRFIEMRVSGAATDSVREQFGGQNQTETLSRSITASSAIGSQVVIDAFVQDVNGRNSSNRRATVTVNAAGTGAGSSN